MQEIRQTGRVLVNKQEPMNDTDFGTAGQNIRQHELQRKREILHVKRKMTELLLH